MKEGVKQGHVPPQETNSPARRRAWLLVAAGLLVIAALGTFFWPRGRDSARGGEQSGSESGEAHERGGHREQGGHEQGEREVVTLSAEALEAAKLEFAEVKEQPVGARLRVTGAVETNQERTQQATPLVSGRVERVNVALGDRVRAGATLAVISSPQIAQMHGKLHEAETQLALAERNLARVTQAENRAAVLAAKAKLDEAEAALKRTRRLIELGAGAGKDLVAAETVYRTAQAEYDFQSNIALNREVQEARAAAETAKVDVSHTRDELRALGAPVREGGHDDHRNDTSLVAVPAPVSGTVIERLVNAGAGVEAGKPLFTIADLLTVWVIANVPEAQVGALRIGAQALVRAAPLGERSLAGRVSYIDSRLSEDTRTARVRVEVANPGDRLKAGMFAEVEFEAGGTSPEPTGLVVPEAAVQRIGERAVVFVARGDEPGRFKAREVELGGTSDGYRRVLSGLKEGERVVTKGSFTIKTQLMKGELGEKH